MKTAFSSRTIAFLGNYLPRKCGIATFTSDLLGAVAARHPQSRCFAVPVNDIEGCYQYPDVVRFEIEEQDPGSYRRAADYLNTSDVDVVSLQHEFGIFGGPAGSHLLALLGELKAPVVTTLHTVLRTPNAAQRRVMQKLIAYSSRLVVMTERGQTILREVYQAPPASIDVIPHGIPDVPFFAPDYYKDQFGVGGKTVLLTFGLLSPNKGIEHVLNALPDIVAEFPDVVYIVLGATHPNELRTRGEAYRLGLEAIARKKNLERNVMFHNRFVELRELTEFIGAADLYITPYLEEAQITSGTLAYAFGAGKAVISTPYWHAAELLSQQRGVLVPFADPMAIAREVSGLLRDGTRRNAMSGNAYRLGREMVWSNTAALYMRSFELARRQGAAAPRESVAANGFGHRPQQLPEFNLDCLAREKLAKVAGIVSGHPGLKLDVEGYTDSVGGDAYNQRLSERRGAAVRDYLTQEGMAASAVATNGFGKAGPVASNGAAQGLAAESTGGAGDLRRGDWHGDRHTDRIQLVGGRCDAGAWHSVVGPRSHSFRPPVERLYD